MFKNPVKMDWKMVQKIAVNNTAQPSQCQPINALKTKEITEFIYIFFLLRRLWITFSAAVRLLL